MKALLLFALLAAGGWYGYNWYFAESSVPAKRLAPDGIFFTKERYSEKTDYGVRALKAGSRVKVVRKEANDFVVTDDEGAEFTVPERLLTNDLDVRDAVLRTIADERDKARQHAEEDVLVAKQSRDARIKRMQDDIEKLRFRIDELELQRARTNEGA